MDIYITELETGARLALPMLPEKAQYRAAGNHQTYDIINTGEIKIPNGTKLLTFSWGGTLPGRGRRGAGYVKSHYWREPSELLNIWEKWRKEGTRLRLMITETPINYDVYLDNYSAEAKGGLGDYDYQITFYEAKIMKIYAVGERQTIARVQQSRLPAAKTQNTYTVRPRDTLWRIAQQQLGRGNRYMEIFNLNRDKLKNPSVIRPGQVLTMPS